MFNISTVTINGVKHKITSNDITKCIVTGKWVVKDETPQYPVGINNINYHLLVKYDEDYEGDDEAQEESDVNHALEIALSKFPQYQDTSLNVTDTERNSYHGNIAVYHNYDYKWISNEGYQKAYKIKIRSFFNSLCELYFKNEEEANEFIINNNLVKGKNRTENYYFKEEISYMDTKKPYRKFNNIYKKAKIEDVIKREVTRNDLKDPEFQKLKASILKRNIEMGVDSLSHNELEGIKYTLGYEIETVSGSISEDEAKDLNVEAVHDGSLRGPDKESPLGGEYVSGVMYGDSGFKQIYGLCRILNKNCTVDHRAGVHVHIGSLKWTNEDIVHAYLLGTIIEDEMYSLLPKSRKGNEYCRPLRKLFNATDTAELRNKNLDKMDYDIIIDRLFAKVFKEVSGGHEPSRSLNSTHNHPKGSKCGFNKTTQRYCWLNFVTLMFDTKKGGENSLTLEVRSHSATMNYRKIKNWAKIWVAFCYFVDNYKRFIRDGYITGRTGTKLPLSLENIVLLAYPKGGKSLVKYMRTRKDIFKTSDESVDYPSTEHNLTSIKQIISEQ